MNGLMIPFPFGKEGVKAESLSPSLTFHTPAVQTPGGDTALPVSLHPCFLFSPNNGFVTTGVFFSPLESGDAAVVVTVVLLVGDEVAFDFLLYTSIFLLQTSLTFQIKTKDTKEARRP